MLPIYSSIEYLYPDIEGELQNRHSSLYGRLKTKFNKLYSNFEPDYFISIKGITQLFGITGTPLALKFALENGIIVAVSHTYKNQFIYVNSDQPQQEQIELDCNGNIIDNQCELAQYASLGMKAALLNQNNNNNLYGGLLYVQTTIPKNAFYCREAYVLAFCLATIMINKIPHKFCLEKIFQNISKVSTLLNFHPFSKFNNNQFQLTDGKLYKPLKISEVNSWKLFFTDVLLSQTQQTKLKHKNMKLSIEQQLGEKLLCSFLNIPFVSFHEIILEHLKNDMNKLKQLIINQLPEECTKQITQKLTGRALHSSKETYYPRKKLLNSLEQYRLLSSLNSNLSQQTVEAAIKDSYELLKEQQLINEDIQSLIKFCIKNGALACTFTNQRFLVVMCQKKNLLGIFNLVRAKIFKGENGEDKFENGIQDLIFSSLPSKGIGILNPTTEIWF